VKNECAHIASSSSPSSTKIEIVPCDLADQSSVAKKTLKRILSIPFTPELDADSRISDSSIHIM
jgi:hypothetical protein